MNNIVLLICFVLSFVTTIIITPAWIKKAKHNDIVGRDIHKIEHKKVAEMGGVPVIAGFLIGLLCYVALTISSKNTEANNVLILGVLCSLLITTIIGILDDILGWKVGLRQYEKPIITLLAAIPLVVLNSGTILNLPFDLSIDFKIFYSLIVIPIVILITTNGFNMLAGFNGLEAGQGVIILSTLGFISFFKLSLFWPGAIAFIMVFSLIAFLIFNFSPASVFPGDSLTYSVGALIGILAIIMHTEWILLVIFIPYGVEFFLKMRGHFQQESFASLHKDGSLYVKGVYGLEHVMVRIIGRFKKVREQEVVLSIWTIQIILCAIAWVLV